jgi:hypothetical protein
MELIYRSLLRLYPAAWRSEFGEEMIAVFRQAQEAARAHGFGAYTAFCWRELIGAAAGALDEHLRILTDSQTLVLFPSRRFTMRSGFRFPKSTAVLMTIILAGVVTAIEQAMSISASFPHGKALVPPIQPLRFALFRPFLIPFALVDAVAALVWIGLYLTGRSGWHRLSAIDGESR